MKLRDKITDLKSILAEAHKVNDVLNYEFNFKKADKLARKVYNRMISFNCKYSDDAIKDSDLADKKDPYGLSLDKSVGHCATERIFGENTDTLANLNYEPNVENNYMDSIEGVVQPKINRNEFKLKQQTCTPNDIAKANRYLKNHNVDIKNTLTVTPIKDIRQSSDLDKLINHVAHAEGVLMAKKNIVQLHSEWDRFLKQSDVEKRLEQEDVRSCQKDYKQWLRIYNNRTELIKNLLNKVRQYKNASVLVKYQSVTGYQGPVLDLRPAKVSDLQKYTVGDELPIKLYNSAINTLNSVNYNNVDSSLDSIHKAVDPIISRTNGIVNMYSYDLGVKTVLVKNAVSQDILYQHSRNIKNSWKSEQEFAQDKQRWIKQDKNILDKSRDAGKYLDNSLRLYNTADLKSTVRALRKDLLLTLCQANDDNKNFNPQITVNQARLVIDMLFANAVYAKDLRYKDRATNLIDWIDDNFGSDTTISYRQLNPVNHYIYKRNINNIKKALV